MSDTILTTSRLVLRPWAEDDGEVFFALNSNPKIMIWIGEPHTREQSDRLLRRFQAHHHERGFAPWCVQLDGEVIGWAGLSTPVWRPEVEIGWRLLPEYWSRGFATEAAVAALVDGFDCHGVTEVISFTAAVNVRSQAVMQRLGLRRVIDGGFAHPSFPPAHRLSEHVMFRVGAAEFRSVGATRAAPSSPR